MIDALERLAALGPEQRAELERRLRAARKDRTAPPAAVETALVPLSPGQQRMWFLDQLGPEFPAYVIVAGWRVQGDLDRGALTAAFRAVVERHPILRTVITEVEGEPRQQVRPLTGEPPVSFADLSGLPSEDWQLRLQRIVGEESQRRFDLATGPLIRMRVLRMGPQDHRLLLAAHHIALDGWSLSLVVSDLLYAYAGDTREPLPVGYADFVTRLDEAGLTKQLEYWRQALDGMPQSLELPADPTASGEADLSRRSGHLLA